MTRFLMIIFICTGLNFVVLSQSKLLKCPPNESSEAGLCVKTLTVELIDSPIIVKIYTKTKPGKIIDRTFVSVHANEEKGLAAAKLVIAENYGRLVEIVSNYQSGFRVHDPANTRRYLYFNGGQYCIDPNRIYSKQGISRNLTDCDRISPDRIDAIYAFGQRLIEIVTNKRSAQRQHRLIIGVHNNTKNGGVNIDYWGRDGSEAQSTIGIFKSNVHFNNEISNDDFILVSNKSLFSQFFDLKNPSNIALQEERTYLMESGGKNKGTVRNDLDDGSMSIFFGTTLFAKSGKPFSYINIEGAGKSDEEDASKIWQKQIIKTVITKITVK